MQGYRSAAARVRRMRCGFHPASTSKHPRFLGPPRSLAAIPNVPSSVPPLAVGLTSSDADDGRDDGDPITSPLLLAPLPAQEPNDEEVLAFETGWVADPRPAEDDEDADPINQA